MNLWNNKTDGMNPDDLSTLSIFPSEFSGLERLHALIHDRLNAG